METSSASRSVAFSEALVDGDNNLVWSVQLRNYLMVHDLWDIVKATDEPPKSENDEAAYKAWTQKNIMALHMIQISCEQSIWFVISLITLAKIAWDTLEEICKIPKNVYEGPTGEDVTDPVGDAAAADVPPPPSDDFDIRHTLETVMTVQAAHVLTPTPHEEWWLKTRWCVIIELHQSTVPKPTELHRSTGQPIELKTTIKEDG
nr:hypothetical protein CFP56_07370 [Quercus suber]